MFNINFIDNYIMSFSLKKKKFNWNFKLWKIELEIVQKYICRNRSKIYLNVREKILMKKWEILECFFKSLLTLCLEYPFAKVFVEKFSQYCPQYFSFTTKVFYSFKIIHFRPFLFQKHIFTYLSCEKEKTCIKLLCALSARGWGVKALGDASTKNKSFLYELPYILAAQRWA